MHKNIPVEIHTPLITHCTGFSEWLTPPEYIQAARLVLGGIDLDPASNELANQTVKAKEFFTKDDDGLAKKWHGRIWLNPPYSKGIINKFVDKLLASQFEAAIVLTDAATDTQWFHKLASRASLICFTTRRINFIRADGQPGTNNPVRGSALFYFGDDADTFRQAFQPFGYFVSVMKGGD